MANIDFLIHNSTKKILNLVKNLPDRDRIETAFRKTSQPTSTKTKTASTGAPKQRFKKHPRRFADDDVLESSEEERTTSSATQATADDVVVIKNPAPTTAACRERNDSSDEYCDVTIRTEDTVDCSMSFSTYLESRCSHRTETTSMRCGRPQTAARPKVVVTRNAEKAAKKEPGRKPEGRREIKQERTDTTESTKSEVPKCSEESPSEVSKLKEAKCESKERREREKEDLRVYLDPKLKNLLEKSTNFAKECRMIFNCGVDPPDGQEDYDRRKKRSYEFSSRFSRNYLYQINRTIVEIENIIQGSSLGKGAYKNHSGNTLLLAQKFFNGFQASCLALEAYSKHLPTSIVNGMPEKFRELVEQMLKLSGLFHCVGDKSSDKDNVLDGFEMFCSSMLTDSSLLPQSVRDSSSSASMMNGRQRPSKSTQQQQQQARLSMYSVPTRKDIYWKKAVAALAKKKYQVQSKYKTATFKHRPPPQPAPPPPPPPLKLGIKKDNRISAREKEAKRKCKSAKYAIVDIDTNVSTFVGGEDSETKHEGSVRNCKLRLHAQGFFEKVTKGNQPMNQCEYECILDHFLEIIGEKQLVDGGHKEAETLKRLEAKFGKSVEDMDFQEFVGTLVSCANAAYPSHRNHAKDGDGDKETKRSASMPISGPANVKLVCMQETPRSSSVSQSGSNSEIVSQMQQIDPDGYLRQRLSGLSISQANESNELIYKERGDTVEEPVHPLRLDRCKGKKKAAKVAEAARAPDPVPLQLLPKDMMISIIEYKLLYYKESRQNFMYRKSEEVAPWVLVERVADSLMEETLLTITRDIQVDKILQKIYAQEFK